MERGKRPSGRDVVPYGTIEPAPGNRLALGGWGCELAPAHSSQGVAWRGSPTLGLKE